MATKIRISGEVGIDLLPASVIDALAAAQGADLDIEIASPGGDVFSGIEIFNALRDFRRTNPGARITVAIKGIAASMASYIAAVDVADHVSAEDNAVGMYHLPWNVAAGDFREMEKNAEFLKGLAELMAQAYAKRSGKSTPAMMELMSAETWLFGQELKDAGFVDEIIPAPDAQKEEPAAAIARAKAAFGKMRSDLAALKPDPMKAAAIMRSVTGATGGPSPSTDAEAAAETRLNETLVRLGLADAERIPGPEKREPGFAVEVNGTAFEDQTEAAKYQERVRKEIKAPGETLEV